jgi:hypothetical protein
MERQAMPATQQLNLRSIVRDALDDTDIAGTRELSDYLINEVLDPSEYEDALRIALPQYVREIIRHARQNARDRSNTSTNGGTKGKKGKNKSRDRSHQMSILRDRVYVNGARMFFGDCTANDVRVLISEYQNRADEMSAMTQRYTRVLALFKAHKANAVRDLPLKEVERALA